MQSKTPPPRRHIAAELFQARWPIWLAAWNVAALVLFLRSLARDTVDVPSWQIVVVAILLLAATNIARWLLSRFCRQPSETVSKLLVWAPFAWTPASVILMLWLTALQPTTLAALFIWLLFATSEIGCLICCWPFKSSLPNFVALFKQRLAGSSARSQETSLIDDEMSPPLDDDVDQTLTRSQRDGVDGVHGLLRVRYEPGQRVASLFAGFAPPLIPAPTAEAEVVWGSEARVSVAEIHAQGIELELRRDSVDDGETSTIVEFYARTADPA